MAFVSWPIYLVCVACHLCGFLLFLRGFFPTKVVVLGHNSFENNVSPFVPDDLESVAQFDKLVVMVVDAMRSDFMYSSSKSLMSFVHSLIRDGNAIPFTAYSNPPTVTLPRLKGLTTGGPPSFIDAVLNIADDKDTSQGLSSTDSWPFQFKNMEKGRKLHFFGDDTWLKLFPPENFFEVFEGTNSFFVSDFTDVDNNVTRHLDVELEGDSWDALILHYLGLDHIGHKGGPDSVFMQPKQREMDDVVRRIYDAITKSSNSTLFVLLGDHGMNEIGNHGGSSAGETHPGMMFVSPKLSSISVKETCPQESRELFDYYSAISQIDLVPTLAALLNFPIPRNNLGVVISEFLPLWARNESRNQVLLENCKQFMQLLSAKYSPDDATFINLSEEYETLLNTDDNELASYYQFLKKVQALLAQSATEYSYGDIWAGCLMIGISCLISIFQLNHYFSKDSNLSLWLSYGFQAFCVTFAVHFHGSSLIEEEYQLWWFFIVLYFVGMFVCLGFNAKGNFCLCITCIRLIRSWNNSGQKFSSVNTVASFLLEKSNFMWVLIIITYLTVSWLAFSQGDWIHCWSIPGSHPRRFKSDDVGSLVAFVVTYVVSSLSFLFKLSQYYNDGNQIPGWTEFLLKFTYDCISGATLHSDKKAVQEVNIQISHLFSVCLFLLIGIRVSMGVLRGIHTKMLTDIVNLLVVLLLHQSRVEVIPIFLVFIVLKYSFADFLRKTLDDNMDTAILSTTLFLLCVQNLSFFSIGNTNLLATVDLSNAYNGISSYDVILVAVLTFISNFAVAIYWSLAGIEIIFGDFSKYSIFSGVVKLSSTQRRRILLTKSLYSLTFYSITMANLVGSCVNLRYHLFIWSVFSPKLLFFSSWTILINFLMDLVVGSILILL